MGVELDALADDGISAPASEPGPMFAWRAARVLGLLGLLSLLFGLLTLAAGDRSVGQLVMAGAALVGSFGELSLAKSLHDGRAWTEPWARVALGIVIVVGVLHTVVGLTSGSLWIPLDALVAVWALLAGERVAPAQLRLNPVGLGLVALIVIGAAAVPLGAAAAELAKPAPDPNAVIVVHNQSPRAVLVLAGNVFFGTRSDTTFVAPCGGVARIPVTPADYQDDGRLMAMVAIDQSGQLDAWTALSPAASATYDGSYSITPVWSSGELAGTLPLELVVHPDLTVDSSLPTPASCTPNTSAMPAGG